MRTLHNSSVDASINESLTRFPKPQMCVKHLILLFYLSLKVLDLLLMTMILKISLNILAGQEKKLESACWKQNTRIKAFFSLILTGRCSGRHDWISRLLQRSTKT